MKKNEIRQAEVLKYLVEEYIESIEPVSSKLICEKYVKDSSPATIRIDLNKLEKENYIYQPHTSAGRIPTILGYRHYLKQIGNTLDEKEYTESRILQEILIKHYKDIPRALHYIMQLLAKETEQLSFVAEPEISYGHLDKLDVFKIAENKLLFVVSLDSGLDKTVILKTDYHISEQQLKALVRYVNEEFVGHRIYDIQNRYIIETTQKVSNDNKLLKLFLDELHAAFARISSFYIHFDGSISFLEQPEFDDKSSILKFLGFIQRQEYLVNLMQRFDTNEQYHVLLGEDLGQADMVNFALIFARYEIFGIPGYLGILGSNRMNYLENIPKIRDIARIITRTTKRGMVVPKDENQ